MKQPKEPKIDTVKQKQDNLLCGCECHLDEDGEIITGQNHMWCFHCHTNHRNDLRYAYEQK